MVSVAAAGDIIGNSEICWVTDFNFHMFSLPCHSLNVSFIISKEKPSFTGILNEAKFNVI